MFPSFELAFHLSFPALRTSELPQPEHRLNSKGEPLRPYRDITFIRGPDAENSTGVNREYLYEAQISGVVSGYDDWRWVAYCFADTYYASADRPEIGILDYSENGEGNFRPDPLIGENIDAGTHKRNPREYFLQLFSQRLSQVRPEWKRVIKRLKDSLDQYEKVCHSLVSLALPWHR